MNTDPIADYLTRIRNAARAGLTNTRIPYSKIKEGMSKVLMKRRFIENYKVQDAGKFKELYITLKSTYVNAHFRRVSKPGQRIYIKNKDIKRVRSGLGMIVMSTPKGIMCGEEAYKQKLGGEILCEIY